MGLNFGSEPAGAPVKEVGVTVVSHARKLGLDAFGDGTDAKLSFFKKYGAVTQTTAQTAFMPSGSNGVRCLGLLLRAFVGRCFLEKHASRSPTLRLAFYSCEWTHACRVWE